MAKVDWHRASVVWGSLLASGMALALFLGGGTYQLVNRQIDLQQRWYASFSQAESGPADIVVVGLDDESLSDFKTPVATLHVQIGQFLEAMAVAKPRAVGVDMVPPEVSYDSFKPGLDAALARGIVALRAVVPLVFGRGAYFDGTPRHIHPLFESLLGPERLGWAFANKDADGVVRRFDEAMGEGGQSLPTLTGQMARQLGWPVHAGVLPFYQGPRMGFIPLRAVLDWQSRGDTSRLTAEFGGRVVLLGSLLSYDDQHLVPMALARTDRDNHTHGVYILAHHLRALGNGRLVRELSPLLQCVVGLLLTLSWWLRPGRAGWLSVAVGSVVLAIASLFLLGWGWSVPAAFWILALVWGLSARSCLRLAEVVIERRRLRSSFEGSVSPSVLKEILAGRINPQASGERLDVCVLFSDIRGFTALSEKLSPEDATDLLNRYFVKMAEVIHQNEGTLDKFIGDGIMAIFGSPQHLANPCQSAFNAAVSMFTALDEFNAEQVSRGGPQLRMGIGLHHGPAFVGYIGCAARNSYSAIGDTVNAASRLEQLTKTLGCSVVMSSQVQKMLTDEMGAQPMGEQTIHGRKPMSVYGWTTPHLPNAEVGSWLDSRLGETQC